MKRNFIQKAFGFLSRFFQPSLRTKVALVFILPVLILVVLLSYDHYTRDQQALQEQVHLNAVQLGNVVLGGLRQLMLVDDRSTIKAILADVGSQEGIKRVWIIDLNNVVQQSSISQEAGLKISVDMPGCVECHQSPAASIPLVVETSQSPGNLRVAVPIDNLPECQVCHSAANNHIGVLLMDASIVGMQARLQDDLSRNVLMSFGIILIGMLSSLGLVNWLFIRRVSVIHRALTAFEDGDYSTRIEKTWNTEDELTQLADSFNGMADSIVEHEKQLHELAAVRQHAIIEERERIARELHDGVAQFIGYVNTKLSAARLFLQKGQASKADEHLAQIEKEVQNQSLDVRASILGLRIASQSGAGLAVNLRDYIEQCNRMSDFTIDLAIDDHLDGFTLGAETELQLMRVVQEALSNVRKHAAAKTAQVSLTIDSGYLVVTIHDNGAGFNPWTWPGDQQAHFGLQTMRERAEMVGAQFSIMSEPGRGTSVTVRLKLNEAPLG
jgi:signal transduction histidine kinase